MIWVLLIVAAAIAFREVSTYVPPAPTAAQVADALREGTVQPEAFAVSPARFGRSPNVAAGGDKAVVDLAGGAR